MCIRDSDKGVKVLVDGKQQTFKNQKGVTIYPLFYQNSIYLPLRNIGELTGMDVTWYSAKAENDVNAIFLRMPLSDSKRAEMETYATNLMKQLLDMRTDTQKIKNCASAVKNGGYTDYVAVSYTHLDVYKRQIHQLIYLSSCSTNEHITKITIFRIAETINSKPYAQISHCSFDTIIRFFWR